MRPRELMNLAARQFSVWVSPVLVLRSCPPLFLSPNNTSPPARDNSSNGFPTNECDVKSMQLLSLARGLVSFGLLLESMRRRFWRIVGRWNGFVRRLRGRPGERFLGVASLDSADSAASSGFASGGSVFCAVNEMDQVFDQRLWHRVGAPSCGALSGLDGSSSIGNPGRRCAATPLRSAPGYHVIAPFGAGRSSLAPLALH
jgi:hypothetical protein